MISGTYHMKTHKSRKCWLEHLSTYKLEFISLKCVVRWIHAIGIAFLYMPLLFIIL